MTVAELRRVPHPCDSLEAWEAFAGHDLARYTRGALLLERDRLRLVLLTMDDRPGARNEAHLDWLSVRLAQVEARLP